MADAVVVTSGDRIVGAGPRAAVAIPAGARVVDARGGAILPGFINAHVRRRVQEMLDLGVDLIKFSLETGYGSLHDLPLPTPDEVAAIVAATH